MVCWAMAMKLASTHTLPADTHYVLHNVVAREKGKQKLHILCTHLAVPVYRHTYMFGSLPPPSLPTVQPDTATNLQIIPDSETAQSLGISWTNPDFTGFSEISKFRLFITSSKNPDGFNRTFAGTAGMMDYTIESLSPFTEYTIELFVRNEAGLEGAGVTTTGMTLSLSETHRLTHTYTDTHTQFWVNGNVIAIFLSCCLYLSLAVLFIHIYLYTGLGPVRELEAEALNSTAIRVTWMVCACVCCVCESERRLNVCILIHTFISIFTLTHTHTQGTHDSL